MNHWWKAQKGQAHAAVTATVKAIEADQGYRHTENLRHARLYGNVDLLALSNVAYSRPSNTDTAHRVTLNVIQSCIDTASAKIAKNRPKPTFVTDGADWGKQQRAKKLDKFISGAFYQMGVYEETPRCFTDGGVFGTGLYKVYSEHGELKGERINPDEILVDDQEGIYGKPRTIYHLKTVQRDLVLSLFPKFAKQITDAPKAAINSSMMATDNGADMIVITEAWRLPSHKKAGDGMHFIGIEGADFLFEEWKRPRFPFAIFRHTPKLFGFWGQGTAERLVGNQVEINKLCRQIQMAIHLMSRPNIWIEKGSVVKTHINNDIGNMCEYTGNRPTSDIFQAVAPEVYAQRDNLYQRCFEIEGISQLSSQSKKPAGLDSAVALREFNDIESERFIQVGQRWENFHMDIGRIIIDECRELSEKDPSFTIVAKGKKGLETIKFADVVIEDDGVMMQVFPTSGLSNHPAARRQEVQEMMQAGLIDPDEGLELMNIPDLEASKNLKWAAKNVVREMVENMLDDGVFASPEPYMDLDFGLKYTQMSYNKAKLDGVPEDRLELLRRFMTLIDSMTQESQSQSAPQAPSPEPPMDPMAAAAMQPPAPGMVA